MLEDRKKKSEIESRAGKGKKSPSHGCKLLTEELITQQERCRGGSDIQQLVCPC